LKDAEKNFVMSHGKITTVNELLVHAEVLFLFGKATKGYTKRTGIAEGKYCA